MTLPADLARCNGRHAIRPWGVRQVRHECEHCARLHRSDDELARVFVVPDVTHANCKLRVAKEAK